MTLWKSCSDHSPSVAVAGLAAVEQFLTGSGNLATDAGQHPVQRLWVSAAKPHNPWLGAQRSVFAQRSRMATTPCPPAAQMELSPRLPSPATLSSLARLATIRPPVAAKGCPAASELPLTLSLLRSMAPSGASSPRRALQ